MAGALAIAIATSGATVGAGGSPATGSAEVRSRSTDSGTAVSRDAGPTRSSAGAAPECPPNAKPVGGGCIPKGTAHVVHGERCRSARLAVSHYRALTWERQKARQGALADRTPVVRGKTCRWARFAADTWQDRARSARRSLEVWTREHTLRDFSFVDGNHAWPKAVELVQVVFPGTASWLLSCSAAEGGHGRWVGYGGQAFSTWLRDSDTVGGPLQFRFSTFVGMYRRGVKYVRDRGYRVPTHLRDQTAAWRSALGQAIAGGWARYTGNDDEHWSASWGRGC